MSSRKKVVIKVAEKPKSSKKKTLMVVKSKPRSMQVVKGSGDYRPTSQTRLRGRGDYFGDLLGGLGQKAGNWAQSKLSSLFGFGDYRTNGPKSNSLSKMVRRAADTRSENTSASSPSQNPFVMGAMSVQFAGGPPRIQHREYVGAIYATGLPSFSTTAYRIQPGLRGTNALFPWGCSVAGCFQMYELHGMVLEYVSTSSNYSATSALGSVSLSTVYDAEQPPLSTLLEVNNNEFTTSANPAVSFYHPVECAKGDAPTTVRYVRTSNSVSSGSDERLDDVGVFQVSLNGLVAEEGTQIGELWCSYDITFLKAALPDLHAGTTALFTCESAPSLSSLLGVEGFLRPNPQNSYPVVVSRPLGLPTGACRFNLPTNYNGSYSCSIIVTGDGMGPTAVVQGYSTGTDVENLTILPQAIASSLSLASNITAIGINFATLPGTTANNIMTSTFCFSTIAENPEQNYIDFVCDGGTTGTAVTIAVIFSPLDNDIMSERMVLEKRLKADPSLRAMVNYLRIKPDQPPPLNLCPPSVQLMAVAAAQARSANTGQHQSPAMSLPGGQEPGAACSSSSAPPPLNPSIARVVGERIAEFEEDRWISCGPPSTSGTPSQQLLSSRLSTDGDDALAVALDAALRRRGLNPI
jgi:hypothetical protein